MAVTAAMVKELRQISGAGMMDCKKALTESGGDMDKAVEWLRKKGLSSAAKKAGRIASEGAVSIEISDDHRKGTIAEINSETDFVAQNDNFKALLKKAPRHVHCSTATTVEDLLQTEIDGRKREGGCSRRREMRQRQDMRSCKTHSEEYSDAHSGHESRIPR